MTEREKMLSGELYSSVSDPELKELSIRSRTLLDEFNASGFGDFDSRNKIVQKLFGKASDSTIINKPFYCDYGVNIEVGENFYANFDCLFLDVNKIVIGNNVMFAPRVSIYTAGHPIDKDVRATYLEFGKQVTIGNDVWVGGNVVINPGVNIGSNVVIGSGSVVTKDIPSNVIAVGNPAKVLRTITNEDKVYWEQKMKEYYNNSK